jgi:hypothetical protein
MQSGINQQCATVCRIPTAEQSDMADIDPDRFTLRQVDALREDYAQVMEELDLVKELLARLPTRREQAFTPLRIMFETQSPRRRWSSAGSKSFGGIALT